jgi:hypothetical protein
MLHARLEKKMELDWSRTKLDCFEHQKIGTSALVAHPFFAIFDEMGAGKTKQAIDAACFLYEAGVIDTALIPLSQESFLSSPIELLSFLTNQED